MKITIDVDPVTGLLRETAVERFLGDTYQTQINQNEDYVPSNSEESFINEQRYWAVVKHFLKETLTKKDIKEVYVKNTQQHTTENCMSMSRWSRMRIKTRHPLR